ncbi:MAG: hypothetical protein ABR972_01160 [Acidimicrobiales bacterium]|jgi:hypothetical protein
MTTMSALSRNARGENNGRLGRLRRAAATGLARRAGLARDESGQALVLAILVVLLVSILVPVLATQVNAENAATNQSASSEAALAAAEAGVQEYRNYLDNVPSYYAYNYGTPDGDTALTGWKQIGSSDEWFHYVPDPSRLTVQSGGSAGQMVIEVTGRAGAPGAWSYRSLLVSFKLSGILTDSYYSEYELSDPNEPGVLPNVTVTPAGGSATSEPMNQVQIEYNYTDQNGNTTTYGPMSLSDALCKYHTYDENTFVDSIGSVPNPDINGDSSATASAGTPYYGPYYDTSGITYNVPSTPGWPNAGATIQIPSGVRPCSAYGVGIYNSSVVFNGTAYTNDQFWLCGDPQFNGNPPLISGAPTSPWSYRDNWKGALTPGNLPQGWVDDFYDGCGGQPLLPSGTSTQLGGQQHLPSTTAGLISYVDGTKGNGCLYTGPTMIEFVKGGTMNVWSPLSEQTEPHYSTGAPAQCGSFSPSQPWVTGLPVPVDNPSLNQSGVIYVQSEQSSGANSDWQTPPSVSIVDPSHLALPSTATCINPYYYNLSASSSQCTEGDAIIEGELHGQITLAASGDIVVSRDLTYQCADGSGGASDANPSSVPACNQAGTSDVLGLLADEDLLIAHPNGGNGPICTDDGTETTPPPGISNVVPWSCDISNAYGDGQHGVVTDAAIVTLNGSTYVPDFESGAVEGNLIENGTNINYYPGFNGMSNGVGYNQVLSYDTRLSYLNPPHLLQATDTVWDVVGFVVCGTIDSALFPVNSGAQSVSCPSLP